MRMKEGGKSFKKCLMTSAPFSWPCLVSWEERFNLLSDRRCLSPTCHALHCIPTNSGQPRTSSHGYSEWVLDPIILTFKSPSTLRDNYEMPSGFQGGSDGKEFTCNAGDGGLISGWGKIPWRRKWQPTPVFLPGKSHGQRNLAGFHPEESQDYKSVRYSPQGHKSTEHKWVTKQQQWNALENFVENFACNGKLHWLVSKGNCNWKGVCLCLPWNP